MSSPIVHRQPWLDWFKGLETDVGLRQRVTLRPDTLTGLAKDSPVAACERLRQAWLGTYIPSGDHLAILRQLVDRVRLCSASRLPNVRDYEEAIYSRSPIVASEQEVWGLTGLAGVGKSSIVKALQRALQPVEATCISPLVQARIRPVQYIAMHAERSAGPVLRALANPAFVVGRKNIPAADMTQHLRQWLYTQGTQLLLIDELQALTRGERSSTLIANLISELNSLGTAVVYVFNHSLGHKLMQRPQEDKDRLLAKCLSLKPCPADAPSWQHVVEAYVGVADGWIDITAARDAAELHALTAGLYRVLGFLLLGACRTAWQSRVGRPVTMTDVRAAYQSGLFASQRADVEDIRSLSFSGRLSEQRKDLRSPFPEPFKPKREPHDRAPAHTGVPPPSAAVHLMETALNQDERKVLKLLRAQDAPTVVDKKSATVTKLPRRAPLSVEALRAGAKLLDGRTTKRSHPPAASEEER